MILPGWYTWGMDSIADIAGDCSFIIAYYDGEIARYFRGGIEDECCWGPLKQRIPDDIVMGYFAKSGRPVPDLKQARAYPSTYRRDVPAKPFWE